MAVVAFLFAIYGYLLKTLKKELINDKFLSNTAKGLLIYV